MNEAGTSLSALNWAMRAAMEREVGTPTREDFIYFDHCGLPARIRRMGRGHLWLFRWHDRKWVTSCALAERTVAEIWLSRRVLFPSEIAQMGFLGGVPLGRGAITFGASAGNEPTLTAEPKRDRTNEPTTTTNEERPGNG